MEALPIVDDPMHWQRRAQEARSIAGQLDDLTAKITMLDIANSYDRLAAVLEAKLAPKD
jgi:hypothetical protein